MIDGIPKNMRLVAWLLRQTEVRCPILSCVGSHALKPTIIDVQMVRFIYLIVRPCRVPVVMAHRVQDEAMAESSQSMKEQDEKMASQKESGSGEQEASSDEDVSHKERPPSPAPVTGKERTGLKQKQNAKTKDRN